MEEKTKKRGWVKDAAIIFLAVLLVLTFFSSTILNRSLPEVATEYVTDGTITSKVRGTGTVVAKENYDVTIEQSHKVVSVLVNVGQEVAAGDVLMILQPGESTELEMAMEQLANLEDQYQRSLINASSSDYAREDRNIAKAREELEELKEKLAEATIAPEETAAYEADLAASEALIENLEKQIEEQQALLDECQAELDVQAGGMKDEIWGKKEIVAEKEAIVAEKEAIVKAKQAIVDEKQAVVDGKQAIVDEKKEIVAEKQELYDEKMEVVHSLEAVRDKIQKKLTELGPAGSSAPLEAANARLHTAQAALENAERALETQKVLHSANYDLLVLEANDMMEEAFRASRGISSDAALTDAQVGELAEYQRLNLRVYLPAAAENHPSDELGEAYRAISAAESAFTAASENYSDVKGEYNDTLREYNKNNSNNSEIVLVTQELDAANEAIDAAQEEADAAMDLVKLAQKDVDAAQKEVNAAQKPVDAAKKDLEAANAVLADAKADLEAAKNAVNEAQLDLTHLQGKDEFSLTQEQAELVTKWTELNAVMTDLEKQLTEEKADHDKMKSEMEADEAEYKAAKAAVESKQDALEDLIFNLEQQKKSDSVSAQLAALDRQKLLDQIEKQKAEIEELTSEDEGTEVVSLVTGTVQSISVSAGHEAKAGATLATIEVPDLGYTLTFSVTNDQARMLRVGDTTTVSNFYWGSQINATLTAIKTDPQNPQGSKQLTFDVTGDVTAGSSLTLSIGEKNANYDMVVPNSAIRSDVNGSFVLKITAKNSPLGNRYFATRVNVDVVASDEKYSAISGAIESYDSVITTASRNAPIEPGDQVRLADSNA